MSIKDVKTKGRTSKRRQQMQVYELEPVTITLKELKISSLIKKLRKK